MSLVKCLSRQVPMGSSPSAVGTGQLSDVLDMVGLVWQWTNLFTDAHTRAGLVRGGARAWSPTGSSWYFPFNLTAPNGVRVNTHNKLLLMAPSYDRHGTVGFRCVKDAAA